MKRTTLQTLSLTLLICCAPLLNACSDDFEPISLLNSTRILALHGTPLEVEKDESIALSATVFIPDDAVVTEQSWTFCPYSAGSTTSYACIVESCETTVDANSDTTASLNPAQLITECFDSFSDFGGPPPGIPTSIPESIELIFTYSVTTSDDMRRQAVLRIPYWTGQKPANSNTAPQFERVFVDGTSAALNQVLATANTDDEISIQTLIDASMLDSFTDAAGRDRLEEPILDFFSTAGRFSSAKLAGVNTTTTWKAEELETDDTEAHIYIRLSDQRGGQAVTGPYVIEINQ